MIEAEWIACTDPDVLLFFMRNRSGRAKVRIRLSEAGRERKQRLFLIACCRRIWRHMPSGVSQRAIEIAERYADGTCNAKVIYDAHAAARNLAQDVALPSHAPGHVAAFAATEASDLDFRHGFDRCVQGAGAASLAPAVRVRDTHPPFRDEANWQTERRYQSELLRDIFGNPFRPVTFSPSWRTSTAVALAAQMYESRDFGAMPILADALQDAGCDRTDVLEHCRGPGPHVRGCWVVDRILNKE